MNTIRIQGLWEVSFLYIKHDTCELLIKEFGRDYALLISKKGLKKYNASFIFLRKEITTPLGSHWYNIQFSRLQCLRTFDNFLKKNFERFQLSFIKICLYLEVISVRIFRLFNTYYGHNNPRYFIICKILQMYISTLIIILNIWFLGRVYRVRSIWNVH